MCNVIVFTSLLVSCCVHRRPHHIHVPPPPLSCLLSFDIITNTCLGKTIHSHLLFAASFPSLNVFTHSPSNGTGAKVNMGVKSIRVKSCLMYQLMSKPVHVYLACLVCRRSACYQVVCITRAYTRYQLITICSPVVVEIVYTGSSDTALHTPTTPKINLPCSWRGLNVKNWRKHIKPSENQY